MAKKVTIDSLADAINDILEDYKEDISANMSIITKKVGEKGAQALRNQAKEKFSGNKYASGWGATTEQGRLYTTVIIHNKKQAGLAHLLENGHVKANGTGRYDYWDGIEHIKPVEEKLVAEYENEVLKSL